MQYFVMSVRDITVDAFMPPFVVTHVGAARRDFGDAINSPDHKFSRHPECYEMYHLGMFDDATGLFNNFDKPRQVCHGVEMVKAAT